MQIAQIAAEVLKSKVWRKRTVCSREENRAHKEVDSVYAYLWSCQICGHRLNGYSTSPIADEDLSRLCGASPAFPAREIFKGQVSHHDNRVVYKGSAKEFMMAEEPRRRAAGG